MSFVEIKVLTATVFIFGFFAIIFWIIKEKLKSRGFDLDSLSTDSKALESIKNIALKLLVVWLLIYAVFGATGLSLLILFNVDFDQALQKNVLSALMALPAIYAITLLSQIFENWLKRRKAKPPSNPL
ncbi:hypothetical protein [Asticcacaulis endophyticus]|uniref:Uncharacterized protein n=1 Tax=Asticcacaulis endophyticus TaxID=1395890 RepID=A0A918PSA0_9CAUL|nr:hypothetical protein [Asticcacaulis endophyticus]GGZ20885.1 hypothetical protein GCM10011273_01880 [Asticcacaulis endophyticus]